MAPGDLLTESWIFQHRRTSEKRESDDNKKRYAEMYAKMRKKKSHTHIEHLHCVLNDSKLHLSLEMSEEFIRLETFKLNTPKNEAKKKIYFKNEKNKVEIKSER